MAEGQDLDGKLAAGFRKREGDDDAVNGRGSARLGKVARSQSDLNDFAADGVSGTHTRTTSA